MQLSPRYQHNVAISLGIVTEVQTAGQPFQGSRHVTLFGSIGFSKVELEADGGGQSPIHPARPFNLAML